MLKGPPEERGIGSGWRSGGVEWLDEVEEVDLGRPLGVISWTQPLRSGETCSFEVE